MTQKFVLSCVMLALFLSFLPINAADWWTETPEQKAERLEWWQDARFGMFIHWGLYAMPARHEWVKNRERIPDEEYQKYFELYNPDRKSVV